MLSVVATIAYASDVAQRSLKTFRRLFDLMLRFPPLLDSEGTLMSAVESSQVGRPLTDETSLSMRSH